MELSTNIGPGNPGRLVVQGGPLDGTLLETHKASCMAIYDRHGDLMALFHRIFSDDVWAFSTAADEDWESTLLRLGIKTDGSNAVSPQQKEIL